LKSNLEKEEKIIQDFEDSVSTSNVKLLEENKDLDNIVSVEEVSTTKVVVKPQQTYQQDKVKLTTSIEETKKNISNLENKIREINKDDYDISTMMVEEVWRASSLEDWRKTYPV